MMMRLVRKAMFSRLGFLAAGAGAVYLFDPERGQARRAQLSSQLQGAARRQARQAVGGMKGQANRAEGKIRQATGAGEYHPESQVDLREHLVQVIRSLPFPTTDITVDVDGGRASLRGQIDSVEHQDQVRQAVRAVDGVAEVDDYTYLPGQVPPNKADALRAGGR
jgi:osmotically-inducible protein OsmY